MKGPRRRFGRRVWLYRFAMVWLGGLVGILVAECLIRVRASQNMSGSWRVTNERGLRMNKSQGTARHQLAKRHVTYRFYPPGLRGTPVDPERPNILVLGDSFTFGWLLAAPESVVGRLQVQAGHQFPESDCNLLNAASGGWGLSHFVRYLEEYGDGIDPKAVLVFLNTDDIGRSLRDTSVTIIEEDGDTVLKLQPHNSNPNRLVVSFRQSVGYQWLLEHSHLVQFTRRALILGWDPGVEDVADEGPWDPGHHRFGPKSANVKDPEAAVLLGQLLFRRLRQWCEQRGIELLVFTTGWHTATQSPPSSEPTEAFMETAAAFFLKEGIRFHDLSPVVRPEVDRAPTQFLIRGDQHPNEKGAALIAGAAWPFLAAVIERMEKAAQAK